MSIWMWIGAGVLVALTLLAVVIRALRPKPFEPVEMEFDMRALKQAQSQAESASIGMVKQARMRALNKRLDSLLEASEADTAHPSGDPSKRQ